MWARGRGGAGRSGGSVFFGLIRAPFAPPALFFASVLGRARAGRGPPIHPALSTSG